MNDPYAALSQSEIDKRATDLANAALDPEKQAALEEQRKAAAQAKADELAMAGFSQAAANMLAGLGPQAEAGFLAASKQEGDLGQGLATGVQQDVASRVAADQAFAQSQGQTGGSNIDQAGLHDVVYGLNGQIPGDTFAEQGAAMNQWGLAQPAIALNAGREEISARMAQARTDNDTYAQKLLDIAAQFPDQKAQALQQLNQYEMDKANYRKSMADAAESKREFNANLALQQRSELAQERAAGLTAQKAADASAYKWASLEFQTKKQMDAAKAAAAKGHRPSPSLSKIYGHVVDANGKAILDANGNQIRVAKSATADGPQGKAIVNRTKATSKARVTAFNFATKLLGAPVKNKQRGTLLGGKGAFIADPKYAAIPPGKPGAVYHTRFGQPGDVATTDRPGRAAHDGAGAANYQDAATKVWAEIDGDGLMARFGYSREQVMAIVNDALRRAGWKRK
jgi:hypothetical protein